MSLADHFLKDLEDLSADEDDDNDNNEKDYQSTHHDKSQ